MPTGLGSRVGLQSVLTPNFGPVFVPTVASGGTLVITSGAVTLINGGMTAVTVTDGTNPVTGCTLVISDGTKATASGQNVTGTAESGTYTVKAAKAGYTDSATVTFTCSGGCFILDPNSGTNTVVNAGAVTSWVDSAGNSFTGTGTYKTGGVNGQNAVSFNGTSDKFASPSLSTYSNGSFFDFLCLTPTGSSGSNRFVTAVNIGVTSGYSTAIDTGNLARMTVADGSAHSYTSATISLNNPHYCYWSQDGANGQWTTVDNGTPNNAGGGYTVNGSAISHFIGSTVTSGNFIKMDLYLRIYVNRYPTATERAQLNLRGKTLLGL